MSLADLPVLDMIKSKLKWHQARQSVLAENVANANTPDFKAGEISRFEFERELKNTTRPVAQVAVTHVRHIQAKPLAPTATPGHREIGSWEVTPSGNAVSLEEEMMKTTENQMAYQSASTLYTRALGLLRMAVENN